MNVLVDNPSLRTRAQVMVRHLFMFHHPLVMVAGWFVRARFAPGSLILSDRKGTPEWHSQSDLS